MFEIAIEESYQDGQIIFEEGSSGDWIYVIQSGKVEISRKVAGEKIIIDVLQTNETFGELGFIAKTKRSATALAIGETTIGIIDRSFLDEEFNRLSGDFQKILFSLATRLQKAIENANLGRKEPRIPKVLAINFKTKESLRDAYTENVSSGGIFIKTAKPYDKGERLLLKLQLPGLSKQIKIEAEVAWSRDKSDDPKRRPPGMGIKFLRIGKEAHLALKETLKK